MNFLVKSLACGAAICMSWASAALSAEVTLKYSSWLPANHHVNVNAMLPWFAEIEEVTEGRVKVEMLPKMVGAAASQFDVVRDGLADISFIVTGYTPGRFPLAEMAELAFLGSDNRVVAPAFDAMYRENMARYDEFAGVELMTIFPNAPGHVFTIDKKIETLADFTGQKLRTPNQNMTNFLNRVGAVPILKPANEVFEMISTGAIDGALSSFETLKLQNMSDYMRHALIVPGGLYNTAVGVVMNADSWRQISPEDQEAIAAVSHGKLAGMFGTSFYNADRAAEQAMRDSGKMDLQPASEALVAEIRVVSDELDAAWIERAAGRGMANGADVLEAFRTTTSASAD